MRGRIKVGAAIMQDFAFGHWPQCKAPKGSKDPDQADDADMVFEMKLTSTGRVECTAPGFGARGHYGNGSIFVWQTKKMPDNAKVTGSPASSESPCGLTG